MSTWSSPEFIGIARLVVERTGLVFAPNRCDSLEHAVQRVMRDRAIGDLSEFARKLESGALPWDALIVQMTVGETYFFRDKQHFDFLTRSILPALAEQRGARYRARVWSAGCASGEEAYSLAMALEEQGKLEGAFVLGTDLSRAALARARAARYKKWSLRGFEPRLLERYFEWAGSEVLLTPRVRDQVSFQELNLALPGYPSTATGIFGMDLILCRNVLIYLSAPAIADVARRFFECLSPGGYLITGPSDPLLADAGFEIITNDAGVIYRRPGALPDVMRPPSWQPRAVESAPLRKANREPPAAARASDEERDHDAEGERDALQRQAEVAESRVDAETLQRLARQHPGETWLAILAVRVCCNAAPLPTAAAECRAALALHPLCAELHYLQALMLVGLSDPSAAAQALRKAIYLDPALAIAHFTLGSVLASLEDGAGAERAYRNAERCSRARPVDEPVPLANEISARGLATAAARELSLLRTRSAAR